MNSLITTVIFIHQIAARSTHKNAEKIQQLHAGEQKDTKYNYYTSENHATHIKYMQKSTYSRHLM